jgi:uncharacterized protein (UPF0147 family)
MRSGINPTGAGAITSVLVELGNDQATTPDTREAATGWAAQLRPALEHDDRPAIIDVLRGIGNDPRVPVSCRMLTQGYVASLEGQMAR